MMTKIAIKTMRFSSTFTTFKKGCQSMKIYLSTWRHDGLLIKIYGVSHVHLTFVVISMKGVHVSARICEHGLFKAKSGPFEWL